MFNYLIQWGRMPTVQRISASDAFGDRQWLAIYLDRDRIEIHAEGGSRDVASAFPTVVIRSLRNRFARIFALNVEDRELAIRSEPPIEWKALNIMKLDSGPHRYVVHYLKLQTPAEVQSMFKPGIHDTSLLYARMVDRAHTLGGRKYDHNSYGGGILFQDYGGPDAVAQTVSQLSGRNFYAA
jgi:hypothetical protein